ncbi:MAG: hypothetical protein RIM84_01255 [Alphaproteobacteria bacterium]
MPKTAAGPLAWVSDRDVDLLFCAELHGSAPFATQVLAAAGLPGARFRKATLAADRPSAAELVIEAETTEGSPVAVLVGHPRPAVTPAAGAGPIEGPRTASQALLLAPATEAEAEAERAEGAPVLSYEKVIEWLADADEPHGRFLAEVLRAALDARAPARDASQPTGDALVSAFWLAYWEVARADYPALRMKRPDEVPAGRTWPWFSEADGLRRGISVVHKTDRGAVDMTFSSTSLADLRAVAAALLQPGMVLHASRKETAIRIKVRPVNMYRPFDAQREAVAEGLAAAERLRTLFAEHADTLDIVPLI